VLKLKSKSHFYLARTLLRRLGRFLKSAGLHLSTQRKQRLPS